MTESKNSSSYLYLRLLGYTKPYSPMFALAILGTVVFASSQAGLVLLMEYIADGIATKDPNTRFLAPVALVMIFLVRGVGSFVGDFGFARVAFGVVHDLRVALFNHLTRAPNDYFDKHSTGELASRITFDVAQVTEAATSALKTGFREGGTVIVLLGYLFWRDWAITLVFLVIGPALGLLVVVISRRLRRLGSNIQTSMGNITHRCSELIGNYRVMRIFGGENYERERFRQASAQNRRQNMKMASTTALATPLVQILVSFALGALVFLALTFMIDTKSTGVIFGYITAASLIPKSLRQVTGIFSSIQKGVAAADSIFTQIDQPGELDQGESHLQNVRGAIEFKHLSFSYPSQPQVEILKNVSLKVEPGETVALVGRSGSGKSTLVSLLPRFYQPQSGCITVDGQKLDSLSLTSLRKKIALVNQNITLFSDTVANNIAYGDMIGVDRDLIIDAAKKANAWDFIQRLPQGLDTQVGEDGTRLSGGQRQRIAIARALLKDAPIVVLDEATSALDTESERHIQAALNAVMKNRTTLVIAHRLSTIEEADRIVVMDNGEIVEQGTHTQLLGHKGHYFNLHAQGFDES